MVQGALDDDRILICRDDHYRNAGITFAQVDQSGETTDTGHMQIQQNQVNVLIVIDQQLQGFKRIGFQKSRLTLAGLQRFLDCSAEQRVIIGDNHLFSLQCNQAVCHQLFILTN